MASGASLDDNGVVGASGEPRPSRRIRVLIAEDQADYREALAEAVQGDPELILVGTARDANEAIHLAASHKPDIALVDVRMGGGGGARVARELRTRAPETRVIALSAYADRATILEMVRAGVVGYLTKDASRSYVLDSVRYTMRGEAILSRKVTAEILAELSELLEGSEALAEELQSLDRIKSDLIQILAHELLTPVTIIQGVVQTLLRRRESLGAEEIGFLAGSSEQAASRLKRLAGNVATAARIDRAGVQMVAQPVRVGALIGRAIDEFPSGRRARIRTSLRPKEQTIRVLADPDLALRALILIVENALDLSSEDEPVEIDIRRAADLEIRVHDRGPGVPPEMRGRIFEPFIQLDASTTRGHEGVGIGLYLARRIMEAHGGTIGVESRPRGGSTFVLTFPIAGNLAEETE